MAVDTFNPTLKPQDAPSGEKTPHLLEAVFGDGYRQIAQDGLNPLSAKWPLTFVGTEAEVAPIATFLDAHVGVSFYWTPPMSVTAGLYFHRGYSLTPKGGSNAVLSVRLEETFSP